MHQQIKNALSEEQANEIISVAKNNLKIARGKRGTNGCLMRQASIQIDKIEWLRSRIYELAEKAIWGFLTEEGISIDISGGIEKNNKGNECGIYCEYDKGSFYAWHTDVSNLTTEKLKKRSLSVTIQLSKPQDYEKGELLLKKGEQTITSSKEQGNMCVFTSDTWHKVSEITKGTRKSLVFWLHKK